MRNLLLGAILCFGVACSGSSSDAQVGSGVAVNQAPRLGCVKGVSTAGGARILVCWGEAQDDADAPSAVRYRVYLSATSGGHNFASPVATSSPGANCMQLSSANSSLIAVGAEVFVVVRAVDSAGLENENTVECACTCVDPQNVAYVHNTKSVGVLGDSTNPFPNIQSAIDAIPAEGGLVLIAGGTYSELAAATDRGDLISTIGIYGSFSATDFTAGATAQTLLGGVDFDANPTILDGNGLDPAPAIGHLDIQNNHRRTYVGSIAFRDNERQTLLGGIGVNLVVCCCSFVDSDPSITDTDSPLHGIFLSDDGVRDGTEMPLVAGNGVLANRFSLVGSFFDEFRDDGSENLSTGCVHLEDTFDLIEIGGCRAEDSFAFVTALVDAAPGSAFTVRFECNDAARINFGPSFSGDFNSGPLLVEDQTDGLAMVAGVVAGSVNIHILRNRVAGADRGLEIRGFGNHGTSHTLRSEGNFLAAVDSRGVSWNPFFNNEDDSDVLSATTLNYSSTRDTFGGMNSEGFEVRSLTPPAGATVTVTVRELALIQGDSEAVEVGQLFSQIDDTPFSQDGTNQTFTFEMCSVFSVDGFVRVSQSAYRGGSTILSATDNACDGLTDEFLDLNLGPLYTNVTSLPNDATLEERITVTDNVARNSDESSNEFCRLRLNVHSPMSHVTVSRNDARRTDELLDADYTFGTAPNINFTNYVEGNFLRSSDDDGCVDIFFASEEEGERGAGDAFVRICNNDFHSGRDNIEIRDDFETGPSIRGYAVIAYNTIKGPTEGDGTDFRVANGTWSLLFARNQVFAGGDDDEPALNIAVDGQTSMGLDAMVRNNLAAFSGDGFGHNGSGMPVGQFVNNTVAFVGHGPSDMILGTRTSVTVAESREMGIHSPNYIHNCISHGNIAFDINPTSIATYSILEEPFSSAGMGSILGNPLFTLNGDITTPLGFVALRADSPTFNAGDPSSEFNDPNGTRNDMGAFGGPGAGTLGPLATTDAACPLLIVGIDPMVDLQAGASFLEGGTAVTVAFTQDINGATANSSSLAFDADGVPVPGAYATNGRHVTFTPTADWPAGARVRLTGRTSLRSTLNQALDFQHVRWFATAPATTTAETEPNDSSATATALPNDAVVRASGSLTSGVDSDFFSFSGVAGERTQVALFGHRLAQLVGAIPADIDFRIQLIASDGVTVLFDNDAALPQGDPFIDFTLPSTGTYYVRVLDSDQLGTGPIGYILEMWRN